MHQEGDASLPMYVDKELRLTGKQERPHLRDKGFNPPVVSAPYTFNPQPSSAQ